MPLASSGLLSSATRQAFRVIHNPPNVSSARGLHTQPFVPRPPQSSSFTSRALHRTKTIFNAFVGHLTTPGTHLVPGRAPRSIHSVASRIPTIENNLSLPVRHALSMRMGSPRLPRPPAVPRSIAQVGLGTARNFTTGRPIFQNIADKIHNIPVASRAFLEAGLDTRTKDDSVRAFKAEKKSKKRSRPESLVRPTKVEFHPAATRRGDDESAAATEFDKYFVPPRVPDVSTTLLIPLAPTPTARVPLSHTLAYNRHPLIPLMELSALHVDSERHASRVKALFQQLDAAQVWDKGATCEAFGSVRGAGVLRVHFSGWSAHAVRGILGEAATGWCILEEERADEIGDEELDAAMSDVDSAPDYPGLAELNSSSSIDPAYSFVLPTLDFSASSAVAAAEPTRELASASLFDSAASLSPPSDFETFSDPGYASDRSEFHSWIEPPDALYASRAPSWAGLSFSSAFSQRLEEGPREEVF
ncbi:hypothetical protein EDB84DRAFT_1458214 [Lactarius hengduanensis]|nr:hypothetical protein EDB84DRAFT_1458214 [Lactarius hengduanensis]